MFLFYSFELKRESGRHWTLDIVHFSNASIKWIYEKKNCPIVAGEKSEERSDHRIDIINGKITQIAMHFELSINK